MCRDRQGLHVKFGKAITHICIQSVKIDKESVDEPFWNDATRSRFIRDAFMACRAAYDQLTNDKETLALKEDVIRLPVHAPL